MPDTSITVAVEIENLEEVKELRRELEKIKDLQEDISENHVIPEPDIPTPNRKFPKYFCEDDDGKVLVNTQFEV